jgi:peptidoglycan/LPS O-acetylase OafA/YrhL
MFVIVGLLSSFIASTITYELIEVRLRNVVAAFIGRLNREASVEMRSPVAAPLLRAETGDHVRFDGQGSRRD